MDGLAKGDLNVEVPFVEYRNEIGHISRSLAVFKERLTEAERLRAERDDTTARAVAERKSTMNQIASNFERSTSVPSSKARLLPRPTCSARHSRCR